MKGNRTRNWKLCGARLSALMAGLQLSFCAMSPAADLSIKPGDQVVVVNVQNEGQLAVLEQIDADIWSHDYGIGPIDVHVSAAQRDELRKAGLSFTIKIANLTAERNREIAEIAARDAGDFTSYKDLNGIIAYINNLAATRPDICSVSTFGNSVQGRPMYVLRISGPSPGPKPAVFYHGLIHAREWIAGPVTMYIAEYLVSHYDSDPCIASLVNNSEIYLAPCVNPDGYNYTWTTERLWRKNREINDDFTVGVDINRNFTYKWGYDNGGSSPMTSSEIYRGPVAGSEPETQAIMHFVTSHPNIKAYMDYHSYSQLLMWPYGYANVLPADNAKFSTIGRVMQELVIGVNGVFYQAGPVYTTIYPANGVSIDFVYGFAGRVAFTTELRDTGSYGFLLPADQILPTCQENLQGILYLTRWATQDCSVTVPPACMIDCNLDGIADACELAGNDCNNDGVPDECEAGHEDCDNDGILDQCEASFVDCNFNGHLDSCDIAGGASHDCNANGTPDECEAYCTSPTGTCPPTTIGATPSGYCQGAVSQVVLSASGGIGGHIEWFEGACDGAVIGLSGSLTIPAPTITRTYYARWTGACGHSDCTAITINVYTAPVVTQEPMDAAACSGEAVSFAVAVSSIPDPLSYQWRKNFIPLTGDAHISGQNSPTLTIDPVSGSDAALYDCVILCLCGTAASHAAVLELPSGPPSFLIQPQGYETCAGQSLNLYAVASGNPAPHYQWRRNGQDIPGATSPSYDVNVTTAQDSGSYVLVATTACFQAISDPAIVNFFATATGDGNLDGHINGRDIAAFIDALLNWDGATYTGAYCSYDMNGDGYVDDLDLPGFVAALLNGQ